MFESERQNGNLVTKQSLNYHFSKSDEWQLSNCFVTEWPFGCSDSKSKERKKQPEAYRMHIHVAIPQSRNLRNPSILQENKTTLENGLHNCVSDTGVKMYSIKLNGDRALFAE